MPLRDDHDAALARADALQAELDREREAQTAQSDRIAKLERELAEAREKLERAEETLGDLRPKKPVDAENPDRVPPVRADADTRWKISLPIAAVCLVAIGGLVASRCGRERERHEPYTPPAGPQPPFVVDRVLRDGLKLVGPAHVIRKIKIDYVAADGTLDVMHGRVSIEVFTPKPPEPPDDPDRPTGAPRPTSTSHLMQRCPQPSWTPSHGWREVEGICMSFGREPTSSPRCTPGSIVGAARVDGAPEGLARIEANWSIMDDQWEWTFSISDSVREVQFRRTYNDRDCQAPPVEK